MYSLESNSKSESTTKIKLKLILASVIIFLSLIMSFEACLPLNSTPKNISTIIPGDLLWSEKMSLSEMSRNKEGWQIDARESPKWAYTNGLVLFAIQHVGKETGDKKYLEYAKGYVDKLIDEKGEILNYHIDDFNLDNINSGKLLFDLYEETKQEKYLIALQTLRNQLKWQPRNTKGGFWHKLRYPWQMWLDGLYMAAPFYAEYASKFGPASDFDDIAHQFELLETYAKDSKSGLLYHGWDESTVQEWANPENGHSPQLWGRSMGWYLMGLVDVLDYFPKDHPKRASLINILQKSCDAMIALQDKDGLWYQVLDQPTRAGNYQEATVSGMTAYALLKGFRMGYLNEKSKAAGLKAYSGIMDNFIVVDENGIVSINKCCAVAGLGGSPYRDGTFEYYVGEDVITNDPKGTGPFILASLEYEKIQNQSQK